MSTETMRQYRDPNIRDGETTIYRLALAKGDEAARITAVVNQDGPDGYHFVMTIPHDDLSLVVEQRFARDKGNIRPLSYVAVSKNGDRVVSREEGYFDETAHIQFGGALQAFPRDIMPLLGAAVGLRGLDFVKGEQRRFNLWLAFSVFWEMNLKVEKIEVVQLASGPVKAWRVKVRPSFSQISPILDRVISGLLPDFVLHFAAEDESHRMIRFSFPTGPFPWNPKAAIEAIDLG